MSDQSNLDQFRLREGGRQPTMSEVIAGRPTPIPNSTTVDTATGRAADLTGPAADSAANQLASFTPPAGDAIPTDPAQFQQYLNDHGANPPLQVDGIVGPLTLAAAQQLNVPVPANLAAAAASTPATTELPIQGGDAVGGSNVPAPSGSPLTGPTNPAGSDADVRAKFGAFAWALDIPEVGDILRKAATEGWTSAQLQASIQQTNWWRTSSASMRSWQELSQDDPQEAAAKLDQQKAIISQRAASLGITIDPDRLTQISTDALRLGWDTTQLQSAISNEFHYTPGAQTGSIGQAEQSIRQMAQQYLVPLSDDALGSWDKQIAAGTATADTFRQYIVGQAKNMYQAFAPQLDAQTTTVLADPYRQTAARELGINPAQVDFMDPKWQVALHQIDPKTNLPTMMSIPDWTKTLRSDPTYGWQYTKNGQDATYQFQHNLLTALDKAPV